MVKLPDDVMDSVSKDDIKVMNSELETESGKKPDAEPSTAKQTVEETSKEESPKEATPKEEISKQASEGEKTPSTEVKPLEVRERHTSKSVPYERFKEVNDKLQAALKERPQNDPSSTPNQEPELDEFGQPVAKQDDSQLSVRDTAIKAVQEILEPIIETLDKDREDQEYQKALDNHPDAKKYEKEIKDYANQTNLTYNDIATLVLAKHQKLASVAEVKQAEVETSEAELGGKSNSTAKRRTPSSADIKNIPDDELEKMVDSTK